MQEIQSNTFAYIDFVLCSKIGLELIHDISTLRKVPFASHNFLMTCTFQDAIQLEKDSISKRKHAPSTMDFESLSDPCIREHFNEHFKMKYRACSNARNINEDLLDINSSIHAAADIAIPKRAFKKKRAWISSTTLALIEERQKCREQNEDADEKNMSKMVKRPLEIDKESYLNGLLEHGGWQSVEAF